MNTFVSLIPQRHKTKNLLGGWWNNNTFHQLGANLGAPIQNFVKRKSSGSKYFGAASQYISDDQTVDTTTTWEDKLRIQNEQIQHQSSSHRRIKQTVVFISRGPPVDTIAPPPPPQQQIVSEQQRVLEKRQRKSQQKNKVLMLLQLEQVAMQRNALRQSRRRMLRDELFVKVMQGRIKHRRMVRLRKLEEMDARIQTRRRARTEEQPLRDLEEYYRKFDTCLEELEDRNEIMELEAFKQLVIREVEERAEALQVFRERLKVAHGQLMQKFIVDELIEGGLYLRPRRSKETLNEWIDINEDDIDHQRDASAPLNSSDDGSEWVVCDF